MFLSLHQIILTRCVKAPSKYIAYPLDGAVYTCVTLSRNFSLYCVQAMARVWRDGQKKTVHIYRLLTAGQNTRKHKDAKCSSYSIMRKTVLCLGVPSLQALSRSVFSRDRCPNRGFLGRWLTWAKGQITPASPPVSCEIFSA